MVSNAKPATIFNHVLQTSYNKERLVIVLTLSRRQKKKIGEKIKKMALAQPPSDAADRNFWRNHTLPGHKNWDALSR